MISFISSLEIIKVAVPDLNNFFWIAASVADVPAVNPNVIKTLLGNDLSTFFIKDNPVFSNVPKILPRNPSYCSILWNRVFDNFILADEQFAKALQSFETYVLVNNNLCTKLLSWLESPTTFDESFNFTSVFFFYSRF